MSVDVRIKQKLFFGKKLDISDIIKITGLSYGVSDEYYRLIKNEIANHTLIYDENKLARGIDLSIDGPYIQLNLSIPTSLSEIKTFYEVIGLICRELKVNSYERNRENIKLSKSMDYITADKNTSILALETTKKEINEVGTAIQLFGIYNPIAIGVNEIKQFDTNLDSFEEYLNKTQSINAYFAIPRFYNYNNRIIGVYEICENMTYILPLIPYVLFDKIKGVNDWYVDLSNGNNEESLVKYNDFINNVNSKVYYDAKNCTVRLNKDEIKSMIEKYSASL